MQSLFIGFREGLESLLLVLILSSYLSSSNSNKKNSPLIWGGITSIIISIFFALGEKFLENKFSNSIDNIKFWLEIVLVISISYLIITMPKFQRTVLSNKEKITKGSWVSLFLITLLICIRELFEIVLFNLTLDSSSWLFSIVGIGIAAIVAYLIVWKQRSFSLDIIFKVTTIYIILTAGYLFGHMINLGIELHYININSNMFIDLSDTFMNTKKSYVGYFIHIFTGVYYKYTYLRFVAQYLFTIILLVIFIILNKKNTSQKSD